MPAHSPRNAVARQWELLKRLPSGPPGKHTGALAQELADGGYLVSKRTVERDLQALESLFPITHGEIEPFDWHWLKGARFGVPGLSLTDALSLQLLERFLKPILPASAVRQLEPTFELAARKLAAQGRSNPLGGWVNKVLVVDANLPVVPAAIDPDVLRIVQEALLADEQVEIAYLRSDACELPARPLCPLGLVQCGPVTYLVATTLRHESPRLYAMHRVRSARRLHTAFRPPAAFSLRRFVDDGALQFGDTRQIRLKAWISPMLGIQLADTRLSMDQQLQPVDDGFVLSATLMHSWRLRWWILSKTGDIHVLAPESLRDEIAKLLSEATARYASETDTGRVARGASRRE